MNWVHLQDKTVTARRTHLCYLCGRIIEKGQAYIRRSGIQEGDGYINAKMHIPCEEMTQDWDQGDWDTFSPGDLYHEIEDIQKGGEV